MRQRRISLEEMLRGNTKKDPLILLSSEVTLAEPRSTECRSRGGW